MSHPLDPVESALVDASNAIQAVMDAVDNAHVTQRLEAIDVAIDTALGAVQRERAADLANLERES